MPAKRNIKTGQLAKKKLTKEPVPKFNWKIAVMTIVALVIVGYVVVRLTEAATAPTGDAAYEQIQVPPSQAEAVQGLKKVKKGANHPCAGAYEVDGKLDAKGKKICTHPSDKLTQTLDTGKAKQLQAQAAQITPKSPQQFIDTVQQSGGKPPADPKLASDPVVTSAAGSLGGQGVSPVVPTNTSCYGSGMDGKRLVVIAAGTKDKPITDADRATIKTSVQQMESILIWNSQLQNPQSIMHFRFMQGADCQPLIFTATQAQDYFNDLSVVTYASLHQDTGIQAAVNQAKQMAQGQGMLPHFLVFTRSGGGACGQSDFAVGGGFESGEAYSYVYGRTTNNPTDTSGTVCWNGFTATHEAFHALGAVDFSAPHTTLFGHCYDERDLMCYDDRAGAVPMQNICPNTAFDDWAKDYLLDCNGDDYFNVKAGADAIFNPNWLLGQQGLAHYNTAKSGFMTSKTGNTSVSPSSPPPTTINPSSPPPTTMPPSNPVPSTIAPPPPAQDSQAPTTPGAISKSLGFDTVRFSYYIDLSWPKSTDNVGVTWYVVKRNSVQIGTSPTNTYRDYSIGANSYYTYDVTAKDAAGNTSPASKTGTIGRCFFIWCWLE